MSIQRLNKNKQDESKLAKLMSLVPEELMSSGMALTESGTIATAYGITAFATGGQTYAFQLTEGYNNVTTCATAKDSVKLPEADAGVVVIVKNSGVASLDVFPYKNDSINNLAIDLAIPVPIGTEVKFTSLSSNWWVTDSEAITLTSPSTQKGSIRIVAADNAGETQTTIINASQAAARTYTIPDAGANANFMLDVGTTTAKTITTLNATTINKSTLPLSVVTVKKTIGGVGVANCDYNFATAGDANEQVITLTNILPAKARLLDVTTFTDAVFTGATTLVAETGTSSSGNQVIASATIYAASAITACAHAFSLNIAPAAAAANLYVAATPGANWSNVTAGKVSVYVTFIDVTNI